MARNLNDKTVVVTGGAQGIGFAIAENFLKNKAKVLILDVIEELGSAAVKTLNTKYDNMAEFYKCDVTADLEKVSEAILNKYKTVDVLVNNAGVVDEKSIKRTMGINAIAVMEWTMKFWEHMRVDKNGKGGTIINVSSVAGFCIDPFIPIYKASKHAAFGFSRCLGHEDNCKKYGVRVVTICPATTDTNLLLEIGTNTVLMKEEYAESLNRRKRQLPDDVGRAAVEVFKNANSGTAWMVKAGQPLAEVPQKAQSIYT